MSGDKEQVATQKLLDLIRGRSGQEPIGERPAAQGTSSWDEGKVILSKEIRHRSKLGGRVRIGLDLGTKTVKMVKMERTGRGFRLLQVGIAPVSHEVSMVSGAQQARIEAAKALLSSWKKEPVVTCLGDSSTLIRQISFPRMPPKELERALAFEARRHMPYDPARMILRHQVLSEDKRTGTCEVLLVATGRDSLREHRNVLEKLGVEPNAIDVTPLALANASLLGSGSREETIVVVDLSATGAVVVVHRVHGLFFSRHLPFAVADVAEQGGAEEKEKIGELAVELRRSLAYYDNVTGRMGFSRILAAGGGAMRKEVLSALERELGLEVEVMDPCDQLEVDPELAEEGWIRETSPLWVQAMGLAMRD